MLCKGMAWLNRVRLPVRKGQSSAGQVICSLREAGKLEKIITDSSLNFALSRQLQYVSSHPTSLSPREFASARPPAPATDDLEKSQMAMFDHACKNCSRSARGQTSLLCIFHSFVAKMTEMTRNVREEHTSNDSRMWLKCRKLVFLSVALVLSVSYV